MSERSRLILTAFLFICFFHYNIFAANVYVPAKGDIVELRDLPTMGKWMISPQNYPADWIGEKYKGRAMKEPINVIVIDHKAKSEADATARLIKYCEAAGFKARKGHSSGYKGYIGGKIYEQIPSQLDTAFSNRYYKFNNDHGRMFGPCRSVDGYVFIGAFSREVVGFYAGKLTHKYGSFNTAREDLAEGAKARSDLVRVSYVDMGSKLDDAATTTGDHDGRAVLLQN